MLFRVHNGAIPSGAHRMMLLLPMNGVQMKTTHRSRAKRQCTASLHVSEWKSSHRFVAQVWCSTCHGPASTSPFTPQEQCQSQAPVADITSAASKLSLDPSVLAAFSFAERKAAKDASSGATPLVSDRSPTAAPSAHCDDHASCAPAMGSTMQPVVIAAAQPVVIAAPTPVVAPQPVSSHAALRTRVRVALLVLDKHANRYDGQWIISSIIIQQ